MNKQELINKASESCKQQMSKADAKRFFNAIFETIKEEVKQGRTLNLVGFGTFKKGVIKGRKGICPLNKQPYESKDREALKFKASKSAIK